MLVSAAAPLIVGNKVAGVYVARLLGNSEKSLDARAFLFVNLAALEVNSWVMSEVAKG